MCMKIRWRGLACLGLCVVLAWFLADAGKIRRAAAEALAALISPEELNAEYIIPRAFDPRVGPAVAKAVAEAARRSGAARL